MSNRNKDAQSPNRSDGQNNNIFQSNPNGSSSFRDSNDFTNPIGSIPYTVVGQGGKARHRGNLYENNPYLDDLMYANNNEDKDALFERAIEWDADYYNLQEQREYNRGVLEEQREYDSPVNQIARQRAAGINPDLAGAGNGAGSAGSNAQMQVPQMSDQQGQTKFNNAYDNANTIFNGINATAGFISSLTGGIGNIMNSFTNLQLLPSQIELNKANSRASLSQAGLSDASANEINRLLAGKEKSQSLGNINSYLGTLSNLSQLLKVGFSDEEGTQLLTSMGIDENQMAGYMGAVRTVHEKPEVLAQFKEDTLRDRKATSLSNIYDQKTIDEMETLRFKCEEVQLQLQYASTALQERIQSALLSDEDYSTNVVDSAVIGSSLDKTSTSLALEQVMYDAQQWSNLLDSKVEYVRQAENTMMALRATAESDGKWTEEELYNYNTAFATYTSLRNITSQEFGNMKQYMMKLYKTRYDRSIYLDSSGKVGNMDFISNLENFSNATFNDIYTQKASTGEIVRGWIGTSAGAVRDLSLAAGGAVAGYNQVKSLMPRPKIKFP